MKPGQEIQIPSLYRAIDVGNPMVDINKAHEAVKKYDGRVALVHNLHRGPNGLFRFRVLKFNENDKQGYYLVEIESVEIRHW